MRSSGSAVLVISLTLLVLLLHLFPSNASFNRSSFPSGFLFGTASSAYQYEGGAKEGGRRPSIWDTYTQRYPAVTPAWPDLILIPGLHEHDEKIKDHSSGDVAVDSYHRYKEDVGIMKDMGLDAFRFSISWPRVLPYGKLSGGDGVNKEGIDYYNKLVNELKANGIEPFVTLFHWDLPQTLEDEYGGFLSSRIVDDFRDYAELCFKEFGDRVKHWITLNEPWTYSTAGYAAGSLAPGRCSDWQMLHCTGGDSSTEPYLVSHHQLLAHASVVQLYRQKYQASQRGEIGITLVSNWMIPYSETTDQHSAAARALDFMLGWFMDPLTKGEYPKSMRSIVGSRLPKFSKEESAMVRGSFDFIGLNYYTANYAANSPYHNSVNASYLTDSQANLTTEKNGILIGKKAASDWLYVYPKGIRNLLAYTKAKYNIPVIYITENGIDEIGNLPLEEALADHWRVDYYHRHLSYVLKAIREDDVNVRGFFAWSLLDNFEWVSGYTVRFGINYVDYKDNLKRYPKQSAHWFKKLLSK